MLNMVLYDSSLVFEITRPTCFSVQFSKKNLLNKNSNQWVGSVIVEVTMLSLKILCFINAAESGMGFSIMWKKEMSSLRGPTILLCLNGRLM